MPRSMFRRVRLRSGTWVTSAIYKTVIGGKQQQQPQPKRKDQQSVGIWLIFVYLFCGCCFMYSQLFLERCTCLKSSEFSAGDIKRPSCSKFITLSLLKCPCIRSSMCSSSQPSALSMDCNSGAHSITFLSQMFHITATLYCSCFQ